MSNVHSILIIDDDPMVREAYRAFLSSQPELSLVGQARNGQEGVEAYAALLPDLVLMDLQMPVLSGIEATVQICQRWPQACIIALTTFGTNEYVVAALRAGAAGYLLKDVGAVGLLTGIRQALAGEMPLSGAVRRELVSTVVESRPISTGPVVDAGLTPRETELLQWLAQGLTNHQIGTQMMVSEGSVKQYLTRIGDKLGVKSRTGILIAAIQREIVDPYALPAISV